MIIQWLDDAIKDLEALRHYISQDNLSAANSITRKILHAIDILSEQPNMGRPGIVTNTRELIVARTPYILPYRVKNASIQILRVFHCAMQWPEDF